MGSGTADLDATTLGLSSVMKSFNVDAAHSTDTMAMLNSIVGQGDMRFQDFNGSIKGWAAPAATFGVSVQSVGAALAYMTDRQVPAAQAGTQLGMSMALMAAPTKQATKILTDTGMAADTVAAAVSPMEDLLKKAGVTTTRMSEDMRKPDGLMVALKDLKDHMNAAGVSADEQDAVIARAFGGGKSGKAIMSLSHDLAGFQQKYDDIGKSATPAVFEAAWEQTTKTTKYQIDQLKASFQNFGIKIGEFLLPYVNPVLGAFSKFFSFLSENKTAMTVFAAIVGGLLVGAFVALIAAISPIVWIVGAVVGAIAGLAVWIKHLWDTNAGFRDFMKQAWADIQKYALEAWPHIKAAASEALDFIKRIAGDVVTWIRDHWSEIKLIAYAAWKAAEIMVVATVKVIIAVVKSVVDFVKVAWPEIVTISKWVWQNVLVPVVNAVKDIIKVIAPIVTTIRSHWDEITQVTRVVWAVISGFIVGTWNVIIGTIKVALAVIKGILDIAWNLIKTTVSIAWHLIQMVISTVWDAIIMIIKVARDLIMSIITVFLDVVTGHWSRAWTDIKDFVGKIWADIRDGVEAIAKDLGGGLWKIFQDIGGGLKAIVTGIWSDIKSIFVAGVNDVIGLANGFLGLISKVAGSVGLSLDLKIPTLGGSGGGGGGGGATMGASSGLKTGSSTFGLAQGGTIPVGNGFVTSGAQAVVGEGNPAHPEYVIPTDPAYRGRALGLFAGLADDLGATRKLAAGGTLSPGAALASGGGAAEAVQRAIAFAQAQNGKPYDWGGPPGKFGSYDCSGFMGSIAATINGTDPGHRYWSTEDAAGRSGQGFVPGLSGGFSIGVLHGGEGGGHTAGTLGGIAGIAPVNVESGGVHNNVMIGGSAAGADNPEFTEHFHLPIANDIFQSAGMGGGSGGGGAGFLRSAAAALAGKLWPTLPTPHNLLGIAPAAVNKLREKVLTWIRGAASGGIGGASGAIPSPEHMGLIDQALVADGIPRDQWPKWETGLNTLISRESGWNAGAVNNSDSNAAAGNPSQGLMQTIPSTFASNRNPNVAGGITDPIANIAAGINYINHQYGGIDNVQQANAGAPPKGYYLGGILGMDPQAAFEHRFMGGPVDNGRPYVVGERGPEVFVPKTAGSIIPAAPPAASARPSGAPFGGLGGATVHVDNINVYESKDSRSTYEAVKQGLADAVARQ